MKAVRIILSKFSKIKIGWDCAYDNKDQFVHPGRVNELMADERLKNVEPKMVEAILNEVVELGASTDWNGRYKTIFSELKIELKLNIIRVKSIMYFRYCGIGRSKSNYSGKYIENYIKIQYKIQIAQLICIFSGNYNLVKCS